MMSPCAVFRGVTFCGPHYVIARSDLVGVRAGSSATNVKHQRDAQYPYISIKYTQ